MSDINEQAAIREVLAGNEGDYRFLVERYQRGLIQHIYNLTHDQHMAEDIAQEAFIRAYKKLSQYNPMYAFSTWLYKIADNMVYRALKQLKSAVDIAELAESLPDDKPSLPEMAEKNFTGATIRQAIEGLPFNYQEVVTLFYWDGFSYEDIALIIERPTGTVRTWLHRAKQELKKELYGQV